MPIHLLFNATITVSSASRSELSNQPIESIGSAGSSISARIEHIEDIPTETSAGLIVQSIYLFYVPANTTIKERDLINCSSTQYRVLSVTDAYGMGSTLSHREVRTVKVL